MFMEKKKSNALENNLVLEENISKLIYCIRGKQVILDSDVATLYNYTTKRINETVKRNKLRFPENFAFQLTKREFEDLRSQSATLSLRVNNGNVTRKYLPYVFTEQGIAMLSGLLRNQIAVRVSINIMNAFVEMRKFLSLNGHVFKRLQDVEYKLMQYDRKFDEVFNELQKDREEFKQEIFFRGQIYDSYTVIIDIIKTANKNILIIDNYIDDTILKMLTKKNKGVSVTIITSEKSSISKLDIQKFNKEYPTLQINKTNKFHDRFIIIDNKHLYHIGASLKDLGKKCFAINKIEDIKFIESIEKNI